MKTSGEVSPNEIHIRGANNKRERSEQKWGSGDSSPEKFLRAHPSNRWKVPLLCKEVAIKRRGRTWLEECFPGTHLE